MVIFPENITLAMLMNGALRTYRCTDIIDHQPLVAGPNRVIINILPPFKIKFYLRARKIRGDQPRPY